MRTIAFDNYSTAVHWQAHSAAATLVVPLPSELRCINENSVRKELMGHWLSTQTVTVTTTVPPYSDSPLTSYLRRSAADPPSITMSATASPVPHTEETLVARTTTSFSPSQCTRAPTAVSSGCSCLLVRSFYFRDLCIHSRLPISVSGYDSNVDGNSYRCPAVSMQCHEQLRT